MPCKQVRIGNTAQCLAAWEAPSALVSSRAEGVERSTCSPCPYKPFMEPLSGTMRMEMYSRYGKATAAMVHMPAFHPVISTKQKPVRVQMDAARLAALVESVSLQNQSSSPSRFAAPIRPSPAFSAVSRQQRANNLKPSCVETPSPTHYSPKADLTHPRTVAGCRMHRVPTCPRGQIVTLGSCWSEGKLMCRFARKTATGEPLAKRPATQKTISLQDFQRTAVPTDLSPLPSSLYLRPNLSFSKQTPRKYPLNPTSQSEESPRSPETASRHVSSPYFDKMQGRRDMFIADQIDEIYDSHPEKVKLRTDICLLDYTKMTPRSGKRANVLPDSPDFPLLQQGYKAVLPHTHVPSIHMGKLAARPVTCSSFSAR